jgi:hypothetical protein
VSEVKVIYLLQPADAGASEDRGAPRGAVRRERCERLPLDTPGLSDALAGFGFDEAHAGVEAVWMPDGEAPSVGALGELQRAALEEVAFDRAPSAIEIVAFVHRVPTLTRAEFQVRYRAIALRLREQDGPPRLLTRYAQSYVLGNAEGPDALGELGFASAEDLRRFVEDQWLFEALLPYESEFIDHSRSVTMLVRRESVPVRPTLSVA